MLPLCNAREVTANFVILLQYNSHRPFRVRSKAQYFEHSRISTFSDTPRMNQVAHCETYFGVCLRLTILDKCT